VQRIFSFLLLLFLPLAALADGMVIPTIAYPAKITIPDQRALICYTNGTERLVIETRFTGAGTNFAWVVPLPSQPVIEEATTGLFPTLQYLFRPEIVHEVPRYYIGILLALGFVYLLRLAAKSVWNAFVIAILIIVPAILLIPALSAAKRAGMGSVTSSQAVSILDRKLVGIFETTTIAAHDATALQVWLSENGFAVPTNAEPVIASYVKDGWVFVATKVRRDKPDNETSTPHPLSFTFKTDKPVYPMRLTGVDNGPLSIELYVFGPSCAKTAYFKVERCARPNYPEPPSNDMLDWRRWSPETPDIVHPLLRKWVAESPVATKLTAVLSPNHMRQDVWIDWIPFSERKNHLFTSAGARTVALNWSAGIWAGSLFTVCIVGFGNKTRRSKLSQSAAIITVCCVSLTGLIYLSLPKTEARLVKVPCGKIENMLICFGMEVSSEVTNHSSIVAARLTVRNLMTVGKTNAPYWSEWSRSVDWANWQNYYLGGPLHEEDSPGNYTIREVNGQLEFVVYDAQGAEHIQTIGE
jgi:hypothetical protein